MPTWATVIVAVAGVLTAAGVIWRFIKLGARAITEREVTAPVLAALARMAPPITDRLDHIEHRLDDIGGRLDHIEDRMTA